MLPGLVGARTDSDLSDDFIIFIIIIFTRIKLTVGNNSDDTSFFSAQPVMLFLSGERFACNIQSRVVGGAKAVSVGAAFGRRPTQWPRSGDTGPPWAAATVSFVVAMHGSASLVGLAGLVSLRQLSWKDSLNSGEAVNSVPEQGLFSFKNPKQESELSDCDDSEYGLPLSAARLRSQSAAFKHWRTGLKTELAK